MGTRPKPSAASDHLATNLFVKGYVGLGRLAGGELNDEDFPPDTNPYSSTLSDLRDGKMSYASIDVRLRCLALRPCPHRWIRRAITISPSG